MSSPAYSLTRVLLPGTGLISVKSSIEGKGRRIGIVPKIRRRGKWGRVEGGCGEGRRKKRLYLVFFYHHFLSFFLNLELNKF